MAAATNHINAIDEAARRRFSDHRYVGLPEPSDRAEIVRRLLFDNHMLPAAGYSNDEYNAMKEPITRLYLFSVFCISK